MLSLFQRAGKHSLRRQLLLWITIPMFVLIPLDTTILYRVGAHFITQSFDESLDDMAKDVIALIHESHNSLEQFQISHETQNVLFSNRDDKTYYAIYNDKQQLLSGNKLLQFEACKEPQQNKCYYFQTLNHERIRVIFATVNYSDHLHNDHQYFVQIGETLNKRKNLRRQILLAILFPQILLLVVTGLMLLIGINKGLEPLEQLNTEITRRTTTQLDPVTLQNVPEETTILITSINLLIGRLRNAIESQNRFIADAAHQLRTPLAGIQAQVELALSQQDNKRSLNMIHANVIKLTHLVNQLLRLSRNQPEAANTIEFTRIDMFTLAQETCAELFDYALQKQIDLGFEANSKYLKDNYVIWGDAQRIKVMLTNLLDNAIRYTPNHGKVTLTVNENAQFVELFVEDNGVGIPVSERDMIFERFHRVLDNSQEGSGLGLSIVKEVLDLHHAIINVETAPGSMGTIMSVKLKKAHPVNNKI